MKLTVIVPVYNGGVQLLDCLSALARSSRPADEVILVDDGSTDGFPAKAREEGLRLVRLDDGPRGPARARNYGAARANDPDILVFIDADVTVKTDTLALIEKYFIEHPEVAALFGSYDDDPPARGVASLYKNLLHHYTHQHSQREASTFWAGCGAIRANAYRDLGGFCEDYERPAVEDIELGMRLRAKDYRIHLCPEIQVTHLKRWTLWSMVRTDVFCRAIPWSRLLATGKGLPDELNLQIANRASAVVALVLVASLLGMIVVPSLFPLVLLCGALFIMLNWSLLRFLASRGGLLFASAAAGLHLLYYLYSSAAFGWVTMSSAINRAPPAHS